VERGSKATCSNHVREVLIHKKAGYVTKNDIEIGMHGIRGLNR